MPELPEVETSKRGIQPHLENQIVSQVIIRQHQLRWPIPKSLAQILTNSIIEHVSRRAKYLLFKTKKGHLIIHLGMSGRLRIIDATIPADKHDHVDIVLANGKCLRYTDPRRFGAILWTTDTISQHPLLKALGPEPLSPEFTAQHLFECSRNRKISIKQLLMDNHVVVGIGNIYATEILFLSKIHPESKANVLELSDYKILKKHSVSVLKAAIKQGGTTLKDFLKSDGKPGYFTQSLLAYGREGQACVNCNNPLTKIKQQQRSTVFCSNCQQMR